MVSFRPHVGQAAVLCSRARFLAAIAGTGGGKTAMGPLWLLTEMQRYPADRWMVLAPTYGVLQRETLRTFLRMFDRFGGNWAAASRTYSIEGHEIVFLSADNPDTVEGGQYRGIWLDEAGQMVQHIWTVVQARLGYKMGRALITTTPYAVNWLKKQFLDRFTKGDPDYFVRTWRSIDNPSYPREEYERARRTLPALLFQRRYEGRFTQLEGCIFSEFEFDYNVRPCFYDSALPIIVGSDFNVSPMAWVLGHRRGDRLEVFDEIWLEGTTTRRTLDVLHGRYADHRGGWEFYGDASSASRNTRASLSDYRQILNDERFQRAGRSVHYPRANPAIADRFAATNAMLCSASGARRLFVDPKCTHLISDLETRYYRVGTSTPADSGDIGHMCLVAGTLVATEDGPVPIEEIYAGQKVWTRSGLRQVVWSGLTMRDAEIWELETDAGIALHGTEDHPVWVKGTGFVPLSAVELHSSLYPLHPIGENVLCRSRSLSTKALRIGGIRMRNLRHNGDISHAVPGSMNAGSIGRFGLTTLAQSLMVATSIIRTGTRPTIQSVTLSASKSPSISPDRRLARNSKQNEEQYSGERLPLRPSGIGQKLAANGIGIMLEILSGSYDGESFIRPVNAAESNIGSCSTRRGTGIVHDAARQQRGEHRESTTKSVRVNCVVRNLVSTNTPKSGIAPVRVTRVQAGKKRKPTYSLQVVGAHEFFANGVLVSNTDALGYIIHRLWPIGIRLPEADRRNVVVIG